MHASTQASPVGSGVAAEAVRACDLAVHTRAAEAARAMYTIGPATKQTCVASFVPEVRDRRLVTQGPVALVLRGCGRLRARHFLERPLAAEPALLVNAIGLATKHSHLALWVPVVGDTREDLELTHMRSWTVYVLEIAATTKSAMHVDAICVATMHTHLAGRVPVVWSLWLHLEGTRCCGGRRRSWWARNSGERKVTAETTLRVNPIRPTSEHTDLALRIPIIWDVRVGRKLATAWRAWDRKEVTSAAESARQMLSISITSDAPRNFTSRIPKIADACWQNVELTLPMRWRPNAAR